MDKRIKQEQIPVNQKITETVGFVRWIEGSRPDINSDPFFSVFRTTLSRRLLWRGLDSEAQSHDVKDGGKAFERRISFVGEHPVNLVLIQVR